MNDHTYYTVWLKERDRADSAEAEVRALTAERDAARAVIRRMCSGWIDNHEPMTPAEAEAIRRATEGDR